MGLNTDIPILVKAVSWIGMIRIDVINIRLSALTLEQDTMGILSEDF